MVGKRRADAAAGPEGQMKRRFGSAIRKELEKAWTLGPDEMVLLPGKRGATCLGFATTFRFGGTDDFGTTVVVSTVVPTAPVPAP